MLKTLKNTNVTSAPKRLQTISERQRHTKDVAYPSARGQIKRKSKQKRRKKQGSCNHWKD